MASYASRMNCRREKRTNESIPKVLNFPRKHTTFLVFVMYAEAKLSGNLEGKESGKDLGRNCTSLRLKLAFIRDHGVQSCNLTTRLGVPKRH